MTSEWQPIETAPKKYGQRILLGFTPPNSLVPAVDLAEWCVDSSGKEEGYWWLCAWAGGHRVKHEIPTHWMPLPKPPATEAALSQQAVSYGEIVSVIEHASFSDGCGNMWTDTKEASRALLEKFNITRKSS